MNIAEVLQKYPETAPVFLEHGLHCVGCPLAQNDTIESAAEMHQIDADKLVKDLNKFLSDK